MAVAFYLPVAFFIILFPLVFWLGRKLTNEYGGLFAALLFAIHPIVITSTMGGLTDTDLLNVFFPLLITFFVFKLIDSKSWVWRGIHTVLILVCLRLFMFAWKGAYYFILFLIGYFIAFGILKLFLRFKDLPKQKLMMYSSILLLVMIMPARS